MLEEGLDDCLELAMLLVLEGTFRPTPPSELVLLRGETPGGQGEEFLIDSCYHTEQHFQCVLCLPCLGVVAVDLLRSTSPISMAFGVVGVAER